MVTGPMPGSNNLFNTAGSQEMIQSPQQMQSQQGGGHHYYHQQSMHPNFDSCSPQCQQHQGMMTQSMFTPSPSGHAHNAANQVPIGNISGSANMASTFFPDKESFIKWIVDRATNHMISDPKHLLDDGLIENAGQVQLPTGDSARVSHVGNYHLGGGDVLKNVLCASF